MEGYEHPPPIKVEDIKDGDLIKILGEEPDPGNEGEYNNVYWYGEKVGVTSVENEQHLEVYIIEKQPVPIEEGRKLAWTYEVPDTIHLIPPESVVYHASSEDGYKKAWKQLGFRYVRKNEVDPPLFYRYDDDSDPSLLSDVGVDDSDSETELDDDSIDDEMSDFIVPDAEPFTRATDDSEYTRYTHESVDQFNSWNPSDLSEKKVKDFINHLETKVRTQDDNMHF